MAMIEVVRTVPEHLEYIAVHMREADKKEIWLSDHAEPRDVLFAGFALSPWCVSILLEGIPVAVVGVSRAVENMPRLGIVWLLGTDDLPKARHLLVDEAQFYISDMFEEFDVLVNYVYSENKRSIEWLKRLGFTVDEAAPYGPEGALFHRFYRVKGG